MLVCVKRCGLAGMSFVRDFLAFDDQADECWYAYATKHNSDENAARTATVYLIPREWVKRIVVRNETFRL
jgi:hypothetical protein